MGGSDAVLNSDLRTYQERARPSWMKPGVGESDCATEAD